MSNILYRCSKYILKRILGKTLSPESALDLFLDQAEVLVERTDTKVDDVALDLICTALDRKD